MADPVATLIAHTTANTDPASWTCSENVATFGSGTIDDTSVWVAGDLIVVCAEDSATATTLALTTTQGGGSVCALEALSADADESLAVSDCDVASGAGSQFLRVWSSRITTFTANGINHPLVTVAVDFNGSSGVRRAQLWRIRPGTGKTIPGRASRKLATGTATNTTSSGGTPTNIDMSADPGALELALIGLYYSANSLASACTHDADNDGTFELTASGNSNACGSVGFAYAAAAAHRPNRTASTYREVFKWVSNPGSAASYVAFVVYATESAPSSADVTDTAGASDTLTVQKTLTAAVSESAPATENLSRTTARSRGLSENAPATEILVGIKGFFLFATDTASASDSVARSEPKSRAITDSAPAVENLLTVGGSAHLAIDTAPATDAIATTPFSLTRIRTDSAPALDTLAVRKQTSAQAADVAQAFDNVFTGIIPILPGTVGGTWTGGGGGIPEPTAQTLFVTATDTAAAADTLTRTSNRPRAVSENAPATEVLTFTRLRFRPVNDNAPATETLTRGSVPHPRPVTDTAVANDVATGSVSSLHSFTRGVVDAAAATDSAARAAQTLARAVTDTAAATDDVTLQKSKLREINDSAPATDATSQAAAARPRAITDIAPALDVVIISSGNIHTVIDQGLAVDTVLRGALVTARQVQDAAPVTEFSFTGQNQFVTVADFAAASDSATSHYVSVSSITRDYHFRSGLPARSI